MWAELLLFPFTDRSQFLRSAGVKRRLTKRQAVEVFASVGLLHCDLTVYPTHIVVHRNDRKLKFYMQLLNYRVGEQQGASGEREAAASLRLKQKKRTVLFSPLKCSYIINVLYMSSLCLKCCGIQCGRSF